MLTPFFLYGFPLPLMAHGTCNSGCGKRMWRVPGAGRMTERTIKTHKRRMRRGNSTGMIGLFVAHAARARTHGYVALRAVLRPLAPVPRAPVRARARAAVAAVAGVFLVTRHAAAAVPRGLGPVGELAPGVVVVSWLCVLVACDARVLAVARKAVGPSELGFKPVALLPVELVRRVDGACGNVAHPAVFLRSSLVVVTDYACLFGGKYILPGGRAARRAGVAVRAGGVHVFVFLV